VNLAQIRSAVPEIFEAQTNKKVTDNVKTEPYAVHCVRQLIGSRPSDHYFRSVCLSFCLCRVFLSSLWSDFDQTWTYVICLGL